jgi:hypothetical protein
MITIPLVSSTLPENARWVRNSPAYSMMPSGDALHGSVTHDDDECGDTPTLCQIYMSYAVDLSIDCERRGRSLSELPLFYILRVRINARSNSD